MPADSSSLQIALAVNFSVVEWLINTSCGATIVGFESGSGHILWSKICQVKPLLSRKRKLQLLPRILYLDGASRQAKAGAFAYREGKGWSLRLRKASR